MSEMMATSDGQHTTSTRNTIDSATTTTAVAMPLMATPLATHPPVDGNQQLEKIINNYNRISSQIPHVNGYDQWVNEFFALMKSEWTRLRTFHARPNAKWTLDTVQPEDLANAGFFFLNGDRVQCAFCRGIVSGWQSGDRPLAEHSRHFPRCPFIMEEEVGNVPIGRDPMREPKRGHDVCGNMRPTDHSLLQSIAVSNRSDVEMKTLDMSEYGVQPHNGPKNPDYASVDTRRRSYRNNCWDESIPVSMDVLAEAGFYSIGMSDYVKCFYCDGGLCNWEPCDDPWVEHAKWFPECQYVLLNKNQAFVNECKQMMAKEKIENQANYDSNTESEPEIYSTSDYDSDEETMNALAIRAVAEWMHTDIVLQMIDLDVGSIDQIKAVLNKRWHDVKQPFTSFAQLYDALTERRPETTPVNNSQPMQTQTSVGSHSSDEHYSSSSDDDYHSGGEDVLPCSQSSVSSTASTLSNYSVSPEVMCSESQASAGDKVEDNRLLCKICLDREIGVVFLPCGHQLACTQCAPCVADCPVCRKNIRGTVRTFFA